jgi:3-oxoacyl-[acyl-carrier protein] reductase
MSLLSIDTIIVTGHTSGLGKEIIKTFVKEKVLTVGISRSKGIDISDLKNTKQNILEFSNRLDKDSKIALILNAGILGKPGGILDSDLQDWQNTIQTNLLGNLAVLQAILPKMLESKFGRIIFIAGGGAANGYPIFSGYSLSKVAIVREVENIALELKDKGDFSVIALAPGAMETNMLKQVREAGAEIKTIVDIQEPVDFIKDFISLDFKKAQSLSGKFIHVRDNLNSNYENKWLLRRIE